jgi:hypothetical protein
MLDNVKASVDTILTWFWQGVAVLAGKTGRKAPNVRRAPVRAYRRNYRARSRPTAEAGPTSGGCIVYRRPERTIGER